MRWTEGVWWIRAKEVVATRPQICGEKRARGDERGRRGSPKRRRPSKAAVTARQAARCCRCSLARHASLACSQPAGCARRVRATGDSRGVAAARAGRRAPLRRRGRGWQRQAEAQEAARGAQPCAPRSRAALARCWRIVRLASARLSGPAPERRRELLGVNSPAGWKLFEFGWWERAPWRRLIFIGGSRRGPKKSSLNLNHGINRGVHGQTLQERRCVLRSPRVWALVVTACHTETLASG